MWLAEVSMNVCKFYLESRGLTLRELAARAETSEPTVGALSRGARVNIMIMRRVAAVFGMPESQAEHLLDEVHLSHDGVPPAPDQWQRLLETRQCEEARIREARRK
jgi:transcriptional regulator with XRE-family HTH domain